MKKLLILLCLSFMLLLPVIFFSGCSTMKSERTGYLNNYGIMSKGKYLDNFWIDKSVVKNKKYFPINIKKSDVSKITNQPGISAEECRIYLDSNMEGKVAKLEANGAKGLFTTNEINNTAPARLEISITQMNTYIKTDIFGNCYGFIQIEGKIIDNHTNDLLAEFSEKRKLIESWATSDSMRADEVRRQTDIIVSDILRELVESFS